MLAKCSDDVPWSLINRRQHMKESRMSNGLRFSHGLSTHTIFISLAMALRLLRALPENGSFASVACASYRTLSASTAAPEPHDFTVRVRRVRLARPQRPPHLTARS